MGKVELLAPCLPAGRQREKHCQNKKIELLAPVGNLSKLKYAIRYGADAVYCGVPGFSLRVRVNSFTQKDLKTAVEYAHGHGKKSM
jgi:putative protease